MSSENSRFVALRSRVEEQFERAALAIAAHPWRVILACTLVVVVAAPQIAKITFSTQPEDSLFPDHPTRVAYDAFKDQFGSDAFVVVTLETEGVFEADFLESLQQLHDRLEATVPYIEEVTSLVNVRSTRGEADELIVEDLFEHWPESEAELAALEARARSTVFYQRTFIGDHGRHTAILLELVAEIEPELDPLDFGDDATAEGAAEPRPISTPEEVEVYDAIRAALADWDGPIVRSHMAGLPVTNVRIIQDIGENFFAFLLFSFGGMVIVLTALFRRVAGVVMPLVVVGFALVGTFGFIGWRGTTVNMTAQILPSFLMAVGASASIHVLVLFFQGFDAGQARPEALRRALGHGGLPITMACFTTGIGLASFQVADLAPIQDLGVMAPMGIAMAWLFAIALLPALLCVSPMKRRAIAADGEAPGLSPVGRAVVAVGDFAVTHPRKVVAASAVLIVVGLGFASRLQFEYDALTWFPKDDPIHLDTAVSDHEMGGSISIEVVVDSGRENGLHDPELQRRIEGFEQAALALTRDPEILRKSSSVNGVLKEIHQALNENRPAFYATPDDRELIAQELLLFEASGSDDLEEMVDSQFRLARISLRGIWGSASVYGSLVRELEALAAAWFPGLEVAVTGVAPIIMSAQVETQRGMLRSYLVALLTITPIMMLMIGSLRGGLVSMVPNLMPIISVLGLMSALGIRIDIFTMLTGSVAIGLAVDDTIHFLHNFYREFDRTGDVRGSVRRTLETTGQALLTTSIVLSLGFGVFLLASMPTLQLFGVITALAIVLAFLADILVAPALVTLVTRHRAGRAALSSAL